MSDLETTTFEEIEAESHELLEEFSQEKFDAMVALSNLFREVQVECEEFVKHHTKGVSKDVKAALRRARISSIQLGKLLKEYRETSKKYDKLLSKK